MGDYQQSRSEQVTTSPSQKCAACGAPVRVLTMLDSRSGRTVHVFKCDCARSNWRD